MSSFIERTLVLIKPDAVKRGLSGEILSRFERAGLTIVALKMLQPSLEHAKKHYPMTDVQLEQMGNKALSTYKDLDMDAVKEVGTNNPKEIGQMIHKWNSEFLSSGPVIACVIQGAHAVKKVRAICGSTMPKDAQPGTIRGDFSCSSAAIANAQKSAVYNLVHASDNENDPDEPDKEIAHWFDEKEILDYAIIDNIAMFKKD